MNSISNALNGNPSTAGFGGQFTLRTETDRTFGTESAHNCDYVPVPIPSTRVTTLFRIASTDYNGAWSKKRGY